MVYTCRCIGWYMVYRLVYGVQAGVWCIGLQAGVWCTG